MAWILDRLLASLAKLTSAVAPWHRWPFPLSLAIVLGHRVIMRRKNLTSTETREPVATAAEDFDFINMRTANGSHNDLAKPWMGMVGARFGRNIPLQASFGEKAPALYDPNPRIISNKLLARREFVPVPHLNILAAAWIQFMVHDWLSHGKNDTTRLHQVPLPVGDDWPDKKMTVASTSLPTGESQDAGRPQAFLNTETHWWDGSQIYGSSLKRQLEVRTDPVKGEIKSDGTLYLDDNGLLPIDASAKWPKQELAGVNGNWWIGLSALHTLFAREHNAIVARLKLDHPWRDGEWLFQKARLVNSALMAKIHTVEWTPALMNSPTGRAAMRGNFWGLGGERLRNAFGRVGSGEILSGIPGSPVDHHAAPYAMTEEFAACYRLHSLMPDRFDFISHKDGSALATKSLLEVSAGGARQVLERLGFDDVVHSLATSNPGALVLHNFPQTLRRLNKKPDEGMFVDLATIDILRDRERGIPRYCEFRRLIGAGVPKDFAGLTDDPTWQAELREVYGTVDKVDLLIGTLAESKSRNGTPAGFGFSDTVFRIFILMASRRLKSDRFFGEDFRPEVYTPAGFAWVKDNSLRTVIARHCSGLAPTFANTRNIFFPWLKSVG